MPNMLRLTAFFILLSASLYAQNTTTYFSKNWDTCLKQEAYYTRISEAGETGISVTDYYPDGKVQMSGRYKTDSSSVKDGYFKYFNEQGFITSEGNYKDGKKQGLWKSYKNAGRLWLEEELLNGTNNGQLKVYFPDGSLKRIEKYENGKLWEGKCYGTNGKDTAFYEFRTKPSYIGGEQAMYQYLAQNTNYPDGALKRKIQGTVKVMFVVDTDGSLNSLSLKQSVNRYLDAEALRIVASMPKWQPGVEDGEPVKVYYIVPIKFVLQ